MDEFFDWHITVNQKISPIFLSNCYPMALIIKCLINLLFGCLLILLVSCKTEQFASNGYFTGDVDKYFNEKEGINVWVYRAFQLRDTGNTGLRTKTFYPLDNRMLKSVGLGRERDKILFSVVPDSRPFYNMIAVKHKKRRFSTENFEKRSYQNATYYQRDYSEGGMTIKHVYIPYGKKESMSLLFYALDVEGNSKDKPLDRFEYLAKINALELKEEVDYKSYWQIFDCDEPFRQSWTIYPNADLLKDRNKIYLKLFDIYGPNKTISYFKLIKKGDTDPIQLKLCPNDYVFEYYDQQGNVLDKGEFSIGKEKDPSGT